MNSCRVILYHKQATSAWLRFLRFANHSVCAFEPLPKLSVLMDEVPERALVLHPAPIIRDAEQQLGLNPGDLEAEGEYQELVDVAGGPVNILLARFTSIDPPFDLAERLQGRFIDLPDARDLSDTELLLLRKAYELLIGD
jgi:hypothetical protein